MSNWRVSRVLAKKKWKYWHVSDPTYEELQYESIIEAIGAHELAVPEVHQHMSTWRGKAPGADNQDHADHQTHQSSVECSCTATPVFLPQKASTSANEVIYQLYTGDDKSPNLVQWFPGMLSRLTVPRLNYAWTCVLSVQPLCPSPRLRIEPWVPANIDTHTHTNIHTHIYSGLYIYILFPRTPILTKQRKQKRNSSFPSLARFRIRLNKSRFHHFRLWSDPESERQGRSLDIRRARNEKFNLEKVRKNKPKTFKILGKKWGNREVAAKCKLVVWASRHDEVKKTWSFCVRLQDQIAYMVLLVPTPDLKVPTFDACYCPLRPHSDFWGSVFDTKDPIKGPLCFPTILTDGENSAPQYQNSSGSLKIIEFIKYPEFFFPSFERGRGRLNWRQRLCTHAHTHITKRWQHTENSDIKRFE